MGESEHQTKGPLKPRTILVADDSVTIRRVVELCFLDTDIRVVSAASGSEAVRKIAEEEPDAVIADVVMSEPDGYALAALVKDSSRPVPVLLLAGTFEPFDGDRARASGADGCLVKPFDSRTLLDIVQRLLQKSPRPRTTSVPGAETLQDEEVDSVLDSIAPGEAPTYVEADRIPNVTAPEREAPATSVSPETASVPSERPAAEEMAPHETQRSADRSIVDSPRSDEGVSRLSERDVDAIARAVLARLSDEVVREIAWEIVPDLAERIVRQRIRELEREEDEVR